LLCAVIQINSAHTTQPLLPEDLVTGRRQWHGASSSTWRRLTRLFSKPPCQIDPAPISRRWKLLGLALSVPIWTAETDMKMIIMPPPWTQFP
jgi:hypothetical protein